MHFEDRFVARLFSAAALLGASAGGTALLPAQVLAASSVNKSIVVPAQATDGNVSTVNGSIRIDDGAMVDAVSTVNGGIRIGNGVTLESAETVNGGIRGGQQVRVREDVESVNGGVEFETGADVAGDIETVNGGVRLDQGRVGGGISTVNGTIALSNTGVARSIETVWGSIELNAGSVVQGDITLRKPHGHNNKPRIPRIVLGPNVEVKGRIVLEHPAEVYVHTSARHGDISGAIHGGSVRSYSGSAP